MPNNLNSASKKESRILIWSLRNIQNFVFNACLYEFEDIITSIDSADIIAPPQYDWLSKTVKKFSIDKSIVLNPFPLVSVNPYLQSRQLEKEYDVYLAILDFPWNISSLNLLKNRHQKCNFSVCYIAEIWEQDLRKLKSMIHFFRDFDLICLGTHHILEDVRTMIDRPCIYLAPGVDAAKFCPNLGIKHRGIDICSLGRRSDITHEALLTLKERGLFYYYDLVDLTGVRIKNHQDHRALFANLLKNSRYFLANHAKADQPKRILRAKEIGYRFFEGAAAGCILIGSPPQCELFTRFFDWEDSIIPVNFDEPNIADILSELDAQPKYLEGIQINNVVNILRRHDWVYRWEQILDKLGMPSTQAMKNRKAYLEKLAKPFESSACPNKVSNR